MPTSHDYEKKFADFIKLCEDKSSQTVIIHHPEVIGDNYEEMVESLNRISDADKALSIVPRKDR